MRVPASTYRLQVTADFDLHEAARRLPYLHALGVDWVYLSPLLAAEPGSDHGYDVVAHDRVDDSRGGKDGLAVLATEARRLGMGVLVDIVPNHVGVATPAHNAWWWDLLTHGRGSRFASAFDVDWEAGGGRILIPVLGDDDRSPEGGPVGNLAVVDGELRYHDNRFPLAPGTWSEGDDPNEVHDRQHYELVNWRVGDTDLNYRRFFTVTSLAGIRVEDPAVFDASHVEIRRWFDEGLVDGLRVDHPDGVRDPKGYLDDLARLTGGAYVLVEKILEPGEELPRSWATAGTTGYDALALVDRVLTDPAGEKPLDALEARLRGGELHWPSYVFARKLEVAQGSLRAEVRRIVREVRELDTSVAEPVLEEAVATLLAAFPVYRSYLPEGRDHFDEALERARIDAQHLDPTAFEVLERVLGDPDAEPAKRFQQTSGMVMAKGVEDCSFYRYSRLTSLNEVGGDPSTFALDVAAFHDAMVRRQADWPHGMTTLTTHDTKRSEDVRTRINALAEVPQRWEEALDRLLALAPLPDPGFGSLLWQAVLGAWPASRDRLHGYAEKAMREAGDHTTWTAVDADYEAAVHAAVDATFDDPRVAEVLEGLAADLAGPGWSNALAAKLVALTMPGVPDVYQGSELWEQSLVDPDNRRPVDFDVRADMLSELSRSSATGAAPPGLTDRLDDPGSAKLLVTHRALTARRDRPGLFTTYRGLAADGEAADHVLAFDRGGAVTVATRLPVGLAARGGWGGTTLTLPAGTWRDALSGRAVSTGSTPGAAGPNEVQLADLLADLPVALLLEEDK
ncbi:malto-oligosyltrehalose synthase [Nocardioides sp. GCM10027113]|uniref:malto-oligosyltrehalose synthase n=1 Tax=unclassified Nocardioides TaxID=2615069 RepID=UPI00360951F6